MTAPHPLQPIRDGIAAVYVKALADGDENLHVLSLAMLVELGRLRRKVGIAPLCRVLD